MRFKLFTALIVLVKGEAGTYQRAGGTDNLETQVNQWLEDAGDIEVVRSDLSTSMLSAQDGSVAKEMLLMVWYSSEAVKKVDRSQDVSGQSVKPLRIWDNSSARSPGVEAER